MAKTETVQEHAIKMLKTAISDLSRGDRIDALDSIRMAQQTINKTICKSGPIAERLFDVEARLGKIIYLPAAHDGQNAVQDLEDFITEDIEDANVSSEFERSWPGFAAEKNTFYNFNDEMSDRDRVMHALDFLQSYCPAPFLVNIEFTIKTITRRGADANYPSGSYLGGWGHYRTQWLLASTIEEACERAIELADAQRRTAWDACKPEKSKKPTKEKAVRRKS